MANTFQSERSGGKEWVSEILTYVQLQPLCVWYVDLSHAFGGSASVSQKFTTRVDAIERIGGRPRLGVPRPGFVNLLASRFLISFSMRSRVGLKLSAGGLGITSSSTSSSSYPAYGPCQSRHAAGATSSQRSICPLNSKYASNSDMCPSSMHPKAILRQRLTGGDP
jgi:hypothetical protein